jgi:hypothetical protein
MNSPHNSVKTDDQLESEGWKLASTTGGEHLKRMLAMYEELGIEVFLKKASSEECHQCTECYKDDEKDLIKVYTRAST